MARAQWGSRLGFILAAAGSAIGLGAIWKFPYVAATNGGGVFLLIYLAICLSIGLVLMVCEMSLGRLSKSSSVGAFRNNGGKAWALVGYSGVLICFLILSFYSVVGGWTVAHLVKSFTGSLINSSAETVYFQTLFTNFISSPIEPIIYHCVFAFLTLWIVLGGVSKGIEMLSKLLMPGLFIILIILVIRSLTLDGAMEGLIYFIKPDFSKFTTKMLVDALGLAFFSLSLGMGIMVTYGSYVQKGENLFTGAIWVIILTVLMCFLSGLMILPAVFAFGFDPSSGPGLTFITMPAIFSQMPMGSVFSVLFFALLLVAALTSSISLLEVVVSFFMDEFNFKRRPAAILVTFAVIILGIFSSLSFGILADFKILGKTIFDALDYLTSNIMMPINEILLAIFVGWLIWGKVSADISENNKYAYLLPIIKNFMRYVIPVLIVIILYSSNFL